MEPDGFPGSSSGNSDSGSQETLLQQPEPFQFQFSKSNATSSPETMQELTVGVQQKKPLCFCLDSPQNQDVGFDAQGRETLDLVGGKDSLPKSASGSLIRKAENCGHVNGSNDRLKGSDSEADNVEDSLEPGPQESEMLEFRGGVKDLEGKAVESNGLLEAEKRRLLAELEVGAIFGGKPQLRMATEPDAENMGLTQGFCEPVIQSLHLEVIHDGVLIDSVPGNKVGNGYPNTMGAQDTSVETNSKKECGRKEKRSRRGGKTVHEDLEKTEWKTDIDSVTKYPRNEDEPPRVYSRKEMEALRFVKVVDQTKLWKDIYKGLGAGVRQEYDELASTKRSRNINLKVDPTASKTVGKTMNKKPENVEDYETENADLCNQAGTHIMDIEGESHEDDDSDDDYGSILRPAFLVEGEPDLDSGPPEDGFEYLRRVRWEAAQIPKVKVAKLGRSKMNKEQSVYMPQIPEIATCLDHLLPIKKWEEMFLTDFSELRQVLSHLEDQSIETSTRMAPVSNNSCQPLEAFILENINHLTTGEMCVGESCSNNGSNAMSYSDDNQNVRTPVSQSVGELPSLSDIQRMCPVGRVSMLRKRISSFEEMTAPTRGECAWLFALCAAVDTPLDADSCASLRSLLRKCASLRAAKAVVDDEVVMLNMLATIAGRYFGQSER